MIEIEKHIPLMCYSPRVRMMAEIRRWSIVPMLRTQDVAQHSCFVAIYALELCKVLDVGPSTRMRVVEWALIHDLPETKTGDTPGPIKRRTVDPVRLANMEFEVFNAHDCFIPDLTQQEKYIIKAANLMDECWKITWENRLGNRIANIKDSLARLRAFMEELGLGHELGEFEFAMGMFARDGMPFVADTPESNDAPGKK